MTTLTFAAAVDIAAAISAGEVSSREITQHYIDRIESLDSSVNALCVRLFEQALRAADDADRLQAKGENLGPLHGVPMSIKESYVHANTPATWGIPAYRDNVASADGLAVARLKAAGAHFLGKTNVPIDLGDFQSYNDIYGTTNNPWDASRHLAVPLAAALLRWRSALPPWKPVRILAGRFVPRHIFAVYLDISRPGALCLCKVMN